MAELNKKPPQPTKKIKKTEKELMFETGLLLEARTKGSKPLGTAGSFSTAAARDKLLAVQLKAKQAFAGTLLFGRAVRQRS